MKTKINHGLLIALALSTVAPLQAQGARQAVSQVGSSIVGGTRYSADWVHNKIESVALPQWARRRVVATLKRFAKPTEKEFAVLKKYMQGQPLNRSQKKVWKRYRNRALSSRGAIATIATVLVAILAAIGFVIHRATRGDGYMPVGDPAYIGKGEGAAPAKEPSATVDPEFTHPEIEGAEHVVGAVEVASLEESAKGLSEEVAAQAAVTVAEDDLKAAQAELEVAEREEQQAQKALTDFDYEHRHVMRYGGGPITPEAQEISTQAAQLKQRHISTQEQVRQQGLERLRILQDLDKAEIALRTARRGY